MRDFARTAETIVAAGIAAVLTLAFIIYSGRVLGPAQFADVSAGLALIYFFGVAVGPVSPTVARVVARLAVRGSAPAIAATRRAVVARIAVWGGVAAIIGVVLSPLIARVFRFGSTLTPAFALCAVFAFAMLSADRGVLQGLLRFRAYNVNVVLEALMRCIGVVILLGVAGRSAVPVMVSYAAALIVAELPIAARLAREWRGTTPAKVDWAEIGELARPMFFFALVIAVFQNADMLAVKRWFSAADSGLYGAAVALAKMVGVIFVPLYALAGPLLASAHESGRRIAAIGVRLSALFIALTAIPLAAFAIWGTAIVTALYGPTFGGGAWLVVPLGGVAVMTYTAIMLAQVLITLGEFTFIRVTAAVAAGEIAALAILHRSFIEVLTILYSSQLAIVVVIAIAVIRVRRV